MCWADTITPLIKNASTLFKNKKTWKWFSIIIITLNILRHKKFNNLKNAPLRHLKSEIKICTYNQMFRSGRNHQFQKLANDSWQTRLHTTVCLVPQTIKRKRHVQNKMLGTQIVLQLRLAQARIETVAVTLRLTRHGVFRFKKQMRYNPKTVPTITMTTVGG